MKIPIIFFLSLSMLIFGCKDKCNDDREYIGAREATLGLSFVDKTIGNDLLSSTNGTLKPSDITVRNSEAKLLNFYMSIGHMPGSTRTYSYVTIRFFEDEQIITGASISKRIFIDLKDDRDTIDYDVKTKAGQCVPLVDQIKIWYNGKLIADTSAQFQVLRTILK